MVAGVEKTLKQRELTAAAVLAWHLKLKRPNRGTDKGIWRSCAFPVLNVGRHRVAGNYSIAVSAN